MTLALSATARLSRRYLRARVAPDHLRRLSEGAQEGAAHAVAIGKTRLPSENGKPHACSPHQHPRHMPAPSSNEMCRSRSDEHTPELQSHSNLVCRLLLALQD